MTEQQKRRVHLPYVRAATDCYAQAIGTNTTSLDLAREGRWYDALNTVKDSCTAAAATMIDVHDRLYGPGTGATFFRGPYLDDLPRAITARLKDAFARRAAEVEEANLVLRKRIEEAERTRDLLRDRMYACTSNELASLVASSEGAEVLAGAAMTICNKEVQAALDAAVELSRLKGPAPSNLRDELRDVVKRNVVASAVRARASAKTESRQASPATAVPASKAPDSGLHSPQACLRAASSLREGQLVDQEKLITMMLDICRPEIENEARSKFLDDPKKLLSELRAQALEDAVKHAKELLHAQ